MEQAYVLDVPFELYMQIALDLPAQAVNNFLLRTAKSLYHGRDYNHMTRVVYALLRKRDFIDPIMDDLAERVPKYPDMSIDLGSETRLAYVIRTAEAHAVVLVADLFADHPNVTDDQLQFYQWLLFSGYTRDLGGEGMLRSHVLRAFEHHWNDIIEPHGWTRTPLEAYYRYLLLSRFSLP
jgi:hypothetical protein